MTLKTTNLKLCKVCGKEKPAIQGVWVMKRGKPEGLKCLACARIASRARLLDPDNRAKAYAARARWCERNKELYRAKNRQYYYLGDNRDKAIARRKTRWQDPEERAKILAQTNNWLAKNPGYKSENSRRYVLKKLKATPKWLTEDDVWLMAQFYELAQLRSSITGILWHVDHIIPLRGKHVCGLHVPANLQVVPAVLNCSKGNRF